MGYIDNAKLRIVLDWLDEGSRREAIEKNFYELNPGLRLKKDMENKEANNKVTKKKK